MTRSETRICGVTRKTGDPALEREMAQGNSQNESDDEPQVMLKNEIVEAPRLTGSHEGKRDIVVEEKVPEVKIDPKATTASTGRETLQRANEGLKSNALDSRLTSSCLDRVLLL